jgi:hypothetical protein
MLNDSWAGRNPTKSRSADWRRLYNVASCWSCLRMCSISSTSAVRKFCWVISSVLIALLILSIIWYCARLDSEGLGYNRCLLHRKVLFLVFLILQINFRSAGRSWFWVCSPISGTSLEIRSCRLTCRWLRDFPLFLLEIAPAKTMFYPRKPYSVSCIFFHTEFNNTIRIFLSPFVFCTK